MQAAQQEDGAVLVEFALVLLPLLLIVFGFLQFGIAMNAKIDSTHLTAEAARYVAVNQNPGPTPPTQGSFQNYIRSLADTEYLKQGKLCVVYPVTPAKVGDPVRVTMARDYPLIPLVGDALTPKLTILNVTSEATMRLEAVPTIIGGCEGAP